MRNDLTELVFILDGSGSMFPLVSDTIGGFNRVIGDNRKMPGECRVTTILFNSETKLLHDHLPLTGIGDLTEKEYVPGGMTALLDAIGEGIRKLDGIQEHTIERERAGKVQFVIITDGFENASTHFSAKEIRSLVSARQEMGWDFIFLGVNMDAISVAGRMGIRPERAVEMMGDSIGTEKAYESVSMANMALRSHGDRSSSAWKTRVEDDVRSRKGRK